MRKKESNIQGNMVKDTAYESTVSIATLLLKIEVLKNKLANCG